MSLSNINDEEAAIAALKYESVRSYIEVIADVEVEDEDFNGVNLLGLYIENCTFKKCNFKGIKFNDATIKDSKFIDCDFSDGEISESTLENVTFDSCILYLTRIENSQAYELLLNDCIGPISLHLTYTEDFEAENCDLAKSDFSAAELQKSKFNNCNLLCSQTDTRTNLDKSVFIDCDITEINLLRAKGLCKLNNCSAKPFLDEYEQKEVWSSKVDDYYIVPSRTSNIKKELSTCAHISCSNIVRAKEFLLQRV